MPTLDRIPLWLPRAIDKGRGVIDVRTFPLQIWLRRDNGFRSALLEQISYNPRWIQIAVIASQSGVEYLRVYGSEGKIDVGLALSDNEPVDLALENYSMDSDAKMTLQIRGWRTGEG